MRVLQVGGLVILSMAGATTAFSGGEAQASSSSSSSSSSNSVYARTPYRVLFSVASVGPNPIVDPTAAPAGANNWSCRPSAQHPDPVVLVHGLGATMAENWSTMSPLLADNGYCVFALTYGLDPGESYVGGVEPIEVSSHQLAGFVTKVLAATGASKVDLVGHSEGTVMPQYYLKFLGGAAVVKRYVALAPLYQGTTLYGLTAGLTAFETYLPSLDHQFESVVASECGSCLEFAHGSPFLKHLYGDGVYAVPGVTYTTIMSRDDELVIPYTSGELRAPNATNIVVQNQCPLDFSEHVTLAFDPVVGQNILNALDPGNAHPVPCTLVLPGIGAPSFP
ncbi:MAG TPA: alpha/beta fold hydrolase [Acidimicrobiales bacterium]|nr:alpha/beta fold hydrolase [Acidimicrobiales bacterium]